MKKDKKKKLKTVSAELKGKLKGVKSAASSLRSNLKTTSAAAKEFKTAITAKPSGFRGTVSAELKKPFVKAKSAKSKDAAIKKELNKKKKKK